ncbi:hypothetical protein BDV96DRAFT_113681 [Lophiotrema nucula]|uniref:Uncharacterized protein n=1 Tax=Lophiotrema nucula TaxID=690887 RepID=A0A6A5Z278_9PLEO|nr:hypothetical protein BDV96DRAFT_113681 [Lophiotrema nucula]
MVQVQVFLGNRVSHRYSSPGSLQHHSRSHPSTKQEELRMINFSSRTQTLRKGHPSLLRQMAMYLPLNLPTTGQQLDTVYRISSMTGMGADLQCSPLKYKINITTGFGQNEASQGVVTLNTTIPMGATPVIQCDYTSLWYYPCPKGRSAMEIVARWMPSVNATEQEKQNCAFWLAAEPK